MYFIYKDIHIKKQIYKYVYLTLIWPCMFIQPALPDPFKTMSLNSKETSVSIPVGFNHQDESLKMNTGENGVQMSCFDTWVRA